MQSRWILGALAAGWLGISACATSTPPDPGGTGGSGGEPGAGGNPSVGPGGAGGTGGAGGSGVPCVLASDCAAFTNQCLLGTCFNGECKGLPTNEDAPCDDGLNCTLTESCQAGVCTAISQKFCPASDSCHVGTCDLATDSCTETAGNDGAGCVDADPCTLTGICNGGTCAPGQPVDCSFLDTECGFGTCDPQIGCKVVGQNDGFPCNDGLFCTDFDECTAGACNGAPKACAPPGNVCLTGACDEFSDTCITTPGNNGAACNDGDLCTAGETCSAGSCVGGMPANGGVACDDFNGCTAGTTCQGGACGAPTSEILACVDNDVCCPAGCQDDSDCIISVGIVYADESFFAADVQTMLTGTAAFTAVDLLDAQLSTPTLAQLMPYKALLVYSNAPFADAFTLGNTLADYFDAGGRVVLAPGANCIGVGIEGRFLSDGYPVLAYGDVDMSMIPDSLGTVFEPGSPLVSGVNDLSAEFPARCLVSPTGGSVTVAAWNVGLPLVVRGVVQGRNRVDLNLFPVSNDAVISLWVGDGAEILKNALLFD